MEKLKFNKNKNLLLFLMFALFTVLQTVGIVLYSLGDNEVSLSWVAESALRVIVCFFIYFTYRNHTKNVMKPLLGAILILLLANIIMWAFEDIQYFDYYLENYSSNTALIILIVIEIAEFVVLLAINVMHYIINATHQSSPNKIKLNKLFFIFYIVLVFAESICEICVGTEALIKFGTAIACFADIFAIYMVILVESSLDEYRIEREKIAE